MKFSGEVWIVQKTILEVNNTMRTSSTIQQYDHYKLDLHENFTRNGPQDKEAPIMFWKSSRKCRPLPWPSTGTHDQIISVDHIEIKILQEIECGARKCPLNFGNHPESADPAKLLQYPT